MITGGGNPQLMLHPHIRLDGRFASDRLTGETRELDEAVLRALRRCDGRTAAAEILAELEGDAAVLRALGDEGWLITVEPNSVRTARRWAVLSPHADDAALSVGGLLTHQATSSSLLLVTLTGASQGEAAPVNHRDQALYWELRDEEDECFARFVGAQRMRCGIADAVLRRPRNELFAQRVDEHMAEISSVIELVLGANRPDLVLAPLGAGGHVDHVDTADAVLSWKVGQSSHRPRVLLYEDLPYAAFDPQSVGKRLRTLRERGYRLRSRVFVMRRIDRKLAAIRLYRTQRITAWKETMVNYARSVARSPGFGERVWEVL
jgi:LmbE family N-acetylglucosaminyl deacetylase